MDLSPEDRDAMIRTIIGEAGGESPEGQAAVAHVILNRVSSGNYGSTPSDVVYAPHQFEAWQDNPRGLAGISPKSSQYQAVGAIVDGAADGKIPDNTGGATNYLNPVLQAQLGRAQPAWAQGQPTAQVGRHVFYNPTAANNATPFSAVTPDDVSATARSIGLSGSHLVPVSSGGGVTISLPSGTGTPNNAPPTMAPSFAPVTQDDIGGVAQSLGLKIGTPQAATTATTIPPSGLSPADEALAQRLATTGGAQQFGEGIPIIGPLLNKAEAATEAAIDPLIGRNTNEPFGQRYANELAITQEADRLNAAAHPVLSTLAQAGGATAAAGPLSETTLGAAALGLPNATRLGATLGGRLYTGATGGALIGGLDAALRGDNPVTGAEVGGAAGFGGPLIGEAAGNLVRSGINAFRPGEGALANVNPIGRGWLSSALANETPASLAAAQQRMGPYGFLADINPAMTELAAGISNRAEGDPSTQIAEAYRVRQAAQRGVINTALDQSFGPSVNLPQMTNQIAEERSAAADPLYERWRNMEVQPTNELESLIPRLKAAKAFDQAQYLAALDGIDVDKAFFTPGGKSVFAIMPGGKLGKLELPQVQQFPTTQTWDYVKRALDSKIDQAYSSGDNTTARSLSNLRRQLIGAIENTNAGQVWQQARAAFAQRSALLDQIQAGRDDFLGSRSGLSVDELREELRGLSQPELQARLMGQRAAADETMGATMNGDTALRNKFLAPNNRQKLALSIGQQRADNLISTLEQQRFLSDQAKYVDPRAGSPTAPRTAAMEALEPPALSAWSPNLTQPLSFIPPSWIDAIRPSTVLQGGRNASYAGARAQIAPLLTQTAGPRLSALLDSIRSEALANTRSAARGTAARTLLGAAIAGPGAETARLRGRFSTLPALTAPLQ